jgi:ribosome-associated protein
MATKAARSKAKSKAGSRAGAKAGKGGAAGKGFKRYKARGPRKAGRGGPERKGPERRGEPGRKAPGRKPRSGKEAALAPRPAAAPVKRAELDPKASPTAFTIASAALDKKAEDVTVLDVRGLTSYADFFVIMTADSDRQASAIADHVEQTMKAAGVSKVGVEGYETGRWILVDYGDVVAHVMNRESREFYDLESLWADAPRFRLEG